MSRSQMTHAGFVQALVSKGINVNKKMPNPAEKKNKILNLDIKKLLFGSTNIMQIDFCYLIMHFWFLWSYVCHMKQIHKWNQTTFIQ